MKPEEFKKLVRLIESIDNYNDVEVELNRAYENGKTEFNTLLDYALTHIKDTTEAEKVVTKFLNRKEAGWSNLKEVIATNEESETYSHNGVQAKSAWHPEFRYLVLIPNDYEAHDIVFCRTAAEARRYVSVDGELGAHTSGIHIYEVNKEVL